MASVMRIGEESSVVPRITNSRRWPETQTEQFLHLGGGIHNRLSNRARQASGSLPGQAHMWKCIAFALQPQPPSGLSLVRVTQGTSITDGHLQNL